MGRERADDDAAPGTTEPWTFGVEPLEQTRALAPLLRRVAGLALSLEAPDPAVDELIDDLRRAQRALVARAPIDPSPRVGDEATLDRRVYLDHGRNIGAYNPVFPEYDIVVVDGARAEGTVTFPLVFEGPPAIVWGGAIASFFDCVIQHHSCEVGQAGKTVSLEIRYRRPTPVGIALRFDVERDVGERITSVARLVRDDEVLAVATMVAVAGSRDDLPAVSPRRVP